MRKLIAFTIVLISMVFNIHGQETDPNLALENLKNKYLKIQDYQADIEINVNVEFINIPNKKAHVYFKYPDKYKFDAKGFFMLPKRGINFSVNELLDYNYTAIFIKKENIKEVETDVIKIIPLDNNMDVVLMTMWIDTKELLIQKIETNTKNSGTFTMELQYGTNSFGLPDQAEVYFEIVPLEIPMNFTGDFQGEVNTLDPGKKTQGSVSIQYSNYIINEGLDDELFEKRKNKKDSVIIK